MKTEEKIQLFIKSDNFFWALLLVLSLAAFLPSLGSRDFFYDDQPLVGHNPILEAGWNSFPRLFSTGYWESVKGSQASVSEYRPLLMATFFAEERGFGKNLLEMHALNLGLNFLAGGLLFILLKRRYGSLAAKAGSLLFVVMTVHLESVFLLVGRSELLSAVFIFSSWICLDSLAQKTRPFLGVLFYAMALLTKESSIMFLPVLFLDDWASSKAVSNFRARKMIYALMVFSSLAYLGLRILILKRPFHGGNPYFTNGPLIKLLTMSLFFWRHYFWPGVSAVGICSDFTRPLIPDAAKTSPLALSACFSLIFLIGISFYFLFYRRSRWAFWVLFPFWFLLPTSHLIIPLDTIGAQRFLYLPSAALAAGFGFCVAELSDKAWARLLAIALILWQASQSFSQSFNWTTPIGFYSAAARCNPVSAAAQYSLGVRFFEKGLDGEGLIHMKRAIELNPRYGDIWYDLARLNFDKKDFSRARFFLNKALSLNPRDSDAHILLGEIDDLEGRQRQAGLEFKKAVFLNSNNPLAQYHWGLWLLKSGKPQQAQAYLRRFIQMDPQNPMAASLAKWLRQVKGR